MDDNQTKELQVVAEQNQLEPTKVELLLSSFQPDVTEARELIAQASQIEVTEESDTQGMQAARELRLKLKKVRLSTEQTRKDLKEGIVREGKAIDGMSNIIKALIVPVEERLEQQEKFAETKALERKAARHAERIQQLSKYVPDVSVYSLSEMSDETFQNLLDISKQSHTAQIEAAAKAEEERKAKEQAEAKEQERIRKENERLKAEQAAKDKKAAEDRKKLEAENAKKEAARQKEREAEAKKLEEERQARLKLEREAQAKRDEEARLAREAEEAKRKALLAPDKEKLLAYADTIDRLEVPGLANENAAAIVRQTIELLGRVTNNIRTKAKEL